MPGSVGGTDTGDRERVRERGGGRERKSCCEVKGVLDMWGVPTMPIVTSSSHIEFYLVTLCYWHNHCYTITISQPLFLTKI